jgi:hypothetical protein
MAKFKTQNTGQSETSAVQWRSSKRNSTPGKLPDNWRHFLVDVTLLPRLWIGRLLLRLSALFARCAVRVAPEMVAK